MDTPMPLATYTALALTGYAAYYLLACAAFPFTTCRPCHGTGHRRAPFGKGIRLCRPCKHTGLRVRLGRRLWTWWSREHQRGTHTDAR